MSRFIPAEKRIELARAKIQEARDLPVPEQLGRSDFEYIIRVKATLKEAKELVALIPKRAGISAELRDEAEKVLDEAAQADKELLSVNLQ